eukprot:jgi/Tetstr1/449956/TSEL_037010.t1
MTSAKSTTSAGWCLARAGWSDLAAASILGAHAAPVATPTTESASATVQATAGAALRPAAPARCRVAWNAAGESIEAGEAAGAPVVPATPVADPGLDDRLAAWAYVGAGGAAGAGGLGLGWVALGALPLDGDAASDAPAARDAPGLPDVLDDVLGGGGDPGSTARFCLTIGGRRITLRVAPPDTNDPPQRGLYGTVAWEGGEGGYTV